MAATRVRNRIRIGQSRHRLISLRKNIDEWSITRSKLDKRGQYTTQLGALAAALQMALEVIQHKSDQVGELEPVGRVYSHCVRVDQGLLNIDQLWRYFRERIDQRDDPERGPVLQAADEVVWSFWSRVWRQYSSDPVPPAPLPYLESHFSPQAIPRDKPPKELAGFGALARELKSLPMPLVALPPSCVEEPWWLIYLAHEVGHHLQYELLPEWGLVSQFQSLLSNTARKSGLPAAERDQRWFAWGLEVFADAFSILQVGPWAIWSISDLVMAEEGALLMSQTQYPSPVVRLAWMASFLEILVSGPDSATNGWKNSALQGIDPEFLAKGDSLPRGSRDLREEARTDLGVVADMARAAAVADFPSVGTLPNLCEFDPSLFTQRGMVNRWKNEFLKRRAPPAVRTAEAPRQVIAGGLAAWADLAADVDDQRRLDHRDWLRDTLTATLAASFEPGTRAVTTSTSDSVSVGEGVGERLWAATDEEE